MVPHIMDDMGSDCTSNESCTFPPPPENLGIARAMYDFQVGRIDSNYEGGLELKTYSVYWYTYHTALGTNFDYQFIAILD